MDGSLPEFKIVVADDSPVYRKLVVQALTKENATYCAKNGSEAVELFKKHQPAVVISDWEMPDLTGIELCAEIRRQQNPYTYVILLTGKTDKEQVIKGLASGADDYLTKPFHPGELLARVAVGRRIADLHREVQAKNRLLEELALTDSLTGLPNRRAVESWAERELSGAGRYGFPVWVAMADLDHFKSVNDNYGHQAGDLVLKNFAELIKANTRASNICGRIGGEEFVIVLSHIDRGNAHTAVERLRRRLEDERFEFNGCRLGVTASFGIAGFQGQKPPEFAELLRQADNALYAAKRNGRNRIEFAC
jgi:two-component system, cell cycle response regulator